MNFREMHESAMKFSFQAKLAMENGDMDSALSLYTRAALIESEVADYYFDKPELEPTRSILIRSAAFLNLKAGEIERAEKYVFWGIANSADTQIKEQFYQALEWSLSFRKMEKSVVSQNIYYLNELRKKSVDYLLEPKDQRYSKSVSLEMISDFADNYTKSIKAFAKAEFLKQFSIKGEDEDYMEYASDRFQKTINPLLTNASYGGFKFSIATDFINSFGEDTRLTKLRVRLLRSYHYNVFTKDFTYENIQVFKQRFTDPQRDHIFRPIFNIRNNTSSYLVSYYDRNTANRHQLHRAKGAQKSELLPIKTIKPEDVGVLESILQHTRETNQGSTKNTIFKQQLKSVSFDYPTNYIEVENEAPIVLTYEILITVNFDSRLGFSLSLPNLPVESKANSFPEALKVFYRELADFAKMIIAKKQRDMKEEEYFKTIQNIISNPYLLN